MYYARLAELERIRSKKLPDFTMIANLDSENRARLMLAESIGRTTALELQNFHLKGREHYGEPPDDPQVWKDALNTDLLIYEGHIEEFALVKKSGNDSDEFGGFDAPLFNRFPFLALLACHSLDNSELLLNRGVSGIIGTCSKIHSASGSAFIKSFFDAMLYEKRSTGEAVRDAKNYALSLVKLKCARGHVEQNKIMRVAFSFRLIGDPEVNLFGGRLQPPIRQRITAAFVDQKTIEINTPLDYLPLVETEGYRLKLFPGAEAAGIFSRISVGETEVKEIHPFYFFRLEPPPNRSGRQYRFEDCTRNATRNISLNDPFGRWIYVLHYPRTIHPGTAVLLQLKLSLADR